MTPTTITTPSGFVFERHQFGWRGPSSEQALAELLDLCAESLEANQLMLDISRTTTSAGLFLGIVVAAVVTAILI